MTSPDPLETHLARLPAEAPTADLAARIVAAVARRQRTLLMWRQIRLVMLICALAGIALVVVSWAHVADTLSPALTTLETNDLTPAFTALSAAPADTLVSWLDAGLAWQSAQAEDIGLLFTLGIALLSVASFAGLAQLLHNNPPRGAAR